MNTTEDAKKLKLEPYTRWLKYDDPIASEYGIITAKDWIIREAIRLSEASGRTHLPVIDNCKVAVFGPKRRMKPLYLDPDQTYDFVEDVA